MAGIGHRHRLVVLVASPGASLSTARRGASSCTGAWAPSQLNPVLMTGFQWGVNQPEHACSFMVLQAGPSALLTRQRRSQSRCRGPMLPRCVEHSKLPVGGKWQMPYYDKLKLGSFCHIDDRPKDALSAVSTGQAPPSSAARERQHLAALYRAAVGALRSDLR
jgi:hypothetical protein